MTAKRPCPPLTADERAALEAMGRRGRSPARQVARARILLRVDDGETDAEIAEALSVGLTTIARVRKRAALEGPLAAVRDRPMGHPRRKVVLDARAEAHLVALASGPPPAGAARWTLRLLTDRLIELGHVERISDETVRKALKRRRAPAPAHRARPQLAAGERAGRGHDGGRARGLPPSRRTETAADLPRRDEPAAARARARTATGAARAARALR